MTGGHRPPRPGLDERHPIALLLVALLVGVGVGAGSAILDPAAVPHPTTVEGSP